MEIGVGILGHVGCRSGLIQYVSAFVHAGVDRFAGDFRRVFPRERSVGPLRASSVQHRFGHDRVGHAARHVVVALIGRPRKGAGRGFERRAAVLDDELHALVERGATVGREVVVDAQLLLDDRDASVALDQLPVVQRTHRIGFAHPLLLVFLSYVAGQRVDLHAGNENVALADALEQGLPRIVGTVPVA